MKLLKILVWVLLCMIVYDVATYLLFARDKSEPKKIAWNEERISLFAHIGSKLELITYWSIGVIILITLISFRDVYFKFLPKSRLTMDKFLSDTSESKEIKKKESFLTCRVSNTTIHSFWEDKDYDLTGQLTAPQLQVLLEELKFTTDEKLDLMENWIENSEEQSKLWSKRLERLETELSYIRHQIFILMSNHTTVNPRLSIGEIPDSRNQMETLRDLTSILTQVKKQFNEDESKGLKLASLTKENDNKIVLIDEYLLKRKSNEKVTEVSEKESKELCQIQEVHDEEKENKNLKLMAGDAKMNTSDSDGDTTASEKSGLSNRNDKTMNDQVLNKVSKPFRPLGSARSLSPVLTLKTSAPHEKPVSPKKSSSFHQKQPSRNVAEPLRAVDLVTNDKKEMPLVKKNEVGGQSPKRTVRFVDEKLTILKEPTTPKREPSTPKRDPSPPKRELSPPKRELSPSSKTRATHPESRGAIVNSYIKNIRDSVNMEMEEVRPSRKSVAIDKPIEKRASSPSPSSRQNKLTNVRSKVADYIKGYK